MTPSSVATSPPSLGSVLVIGGCGFLGHHIVKLLHTSYKCILSVVDVRTTRNRLEGAGVSYFECDITSPEALDGVFAQTKPDVVMHTASPAWLQTSLMKKVNVDGTKAVIEACRRAGVRALVYTSSASVVS